MDFTVADHGSIVILTPLTEAAQDWVADHLPEDAMTWGGGIVIEPRYVALILAGIGEDGLTF
jgi:hypothetical protein